HADVGGQRPPSAGSRESPYLEDVGVVRGELDRDRQPHLVLSEVRHANLLETLPLPKERAPENVDLPARRSEPVAVIEVDVREIHREDRRVVRDARVQQQRPPPADRQLEPRQKARVAVVEPVSAVAVRMNVPETVEYRAPLAL